MTMIDPYGRTIRYLRMSVTDRCDLRCTYCMAERMQFLPKTELLSLDEIDRLCAAFIRKGVRKLRLTGGEPLVRKGVIDLIGDLSRHLKTGALDELTLTTNATQLTRHAENLARAGVKRINVSLDSIAPETYGRITRGGDLQTALDGIAAAQEAGLSVKLNTVALSRDNLAEIPDMIEWAHTQNLDMTLIEVMPLGDVGRDRLEQFVSLLALRDELEKRWTLTPISHRTGGPSRYVRVEETGGRLGFITPLTGNFCEGCNRVRVTCTGQLYLCLGQDDSADLRSPLRSHDSDELLDAAIEAAIARKPHGHDFDLPRQGAAPAVNRHMSVTGG